MNINDIISGALSGAEITLPSGEFEGPVVIAKPLRVRGKNTTIWTKKDAALEIKSGGVSLEGLRVELTESSESDCAIKADLACDVKDVEVLGSVSGFGAEDRPFDVPRTIDLGCFAADAENTFLLSVNVPDKTEILCGVNGLEITPKTLRAGRNDIKITVRGISEKTLLYAEIIFRSRFLRRVYLTGKPKSGVESVKEKVVYTAPERTLEEAAAAEIMPANTAPKNAVNPLERPSDVVSFSGNTQGSLPLEMKRGQRVSLTQYTGPHFEVFFSGQVPNGIEVDPYVFLLDEKEQAKGDNCLIFFGNERSVNGEVIYYPNDGHIEIDLLKVDPSVKKMALAYSVYAGNANKNFSRISGARVSLCNGTERIAFSMNGLSNETTAVAVEFYLYKGEWKVSAVGAGYKDGMARLCNNYGIQVIE